jgi:hypothetical protein
VAASMVAHGLMVRPLMYWDELWRSRAKHKCTPAAPRS